MSFFSQNKNEEFNYIRIIITRNNGS